MWEPAGLLQRSLFSAFQEALHVESGFLNKKSFEGDDLIEN